MSAVITAYTARKGVTEKVSPLPERIPGITKESPPAASLAEGYSVPVPALPAAAIASPSVQTVTKRAAVSPAFSWLLPMAATAAAPIMGPKTIVAISIPLSILSVITAFPRRSLSGRPKWARARHRTRC